MRNNMKRLFLLMLVLLSTNIFAQDSTKVFSQEEFNKIAKYLRDGNIPALSDSLTLMSVQTLKAKLDSVIFGKKQLRTLSFTEREGNIIAYTMRNDLNNAIALLRLQQKLIPPALATNGKAKKK